MAVLQLHTNGSYGKALGSRESVNFCSYQERLISVLNESYRYRRISAPIGYISLGRYKLALFAKRLGSLVSTWLFYDVRIGVL